MTMSQKRADGDVALKGGRHWRQVAPGLLHYMDAEHKRFGLVAAVVGAIL